MADAPELGSGSERIEGSSPLARTFFPDSVRRPILKLPAATAFQRLVDARGNSGAGSEPAFEEPVIGKAFADSGPDESGAPGLLTSFTAHVLANHAKT